MSLYSWNLTWVYFIYLVLLLAVLHVVHLEESACLKHRVNICIRQEFHFCRGKSSNKESQNCLLPQPQQHSFLKTCGQTEMREMAMEVEVKQEKVGRQHE